MSAYLIAERYAKALNASVADDAELDRVQSALVEAAEVIRDHHDFRTLMTNPAITLDRRLTALNDLLNHLKAPDAVSGLVRVLLRRGRILELPRVATFFHELADARLNRVGAEVTTAIPLMDAERETLRKSLAAYSGREIRMTTQVDPAIVGGVVARIGDTVIDGSLRTRLARLKQSLLSHGIA